MTVDPRRGEGMPPVDPELVDVLDRLRGDLASGEDLAIRRVAARLRTPAPRRARGLPLWATGMAMAASVAATLVLIQLFTPTPSETPLAATPLVAVGDEIAAEDGPALVTLPGGGATLGLAAGSTVRRIADQPGGVPIFELDHGIATVDVTSGALPGLRLRAGEVLVSVLGTSFAVTRTADEVTVVVLRGVVRVTYAGNASELAGGESFSTRPAAEDAAGEDAGDEVELAPPLPAPAPPPPASGESLEPGAPALTRVEQDFLAIQDALASGDPAADLIARTAGFLDAHPQSAFTGEVAAIRVEALARDGRHREAYDAAAAFVAAHPASPRRTQITRLQATVARDRLQDCSLALEPYRTLADGTSAAAAEASYYLGVCALDLGHGDEAAAALQRYVELAPDGEHADRARELLGVDAP